MARTQKTHYQKIKEQAERLHKRITQDTEQYNSVVEKLRNLEAARKAEPGDTVRFNVGRGDSKQVRAGEVLGSKPDELGQVQLRVLSGEGFDAAVSVVLEHDIIQVAKVEIHGEES